MTDTTNPKPRWPAHIRQHLETLVIDTDEHLDRARRRMRGKFRYGTPRHIATHVAHGDEAQVLLMGRVLAEAPQGGPKDDDGWWDNLLNTYRRFESDELPDVALTVRFRGAKTQVVTDHEGYYVAQLTPQLPQADTLWDTASISLDDGTLITPQPVLQVGAGARIGIISDIDDTILHSGITNWKTAAQLTFLHNARTRKPLKGVALLYQALQAGADGAGRNPIFYVSSSPWNLHDLLEDFMELNAIPPGPTFLRDIGTDAGKFIKTQGHGHKLEHARTLINRYPQLRWVLLGDSGQHDAELYAQAAQEFGDRIAAIYIRDVDPLVDSAYDTGATAQIERIAGTGVPMLLASDSRAMAEHAASIGLIAPGTVQAISLDVARDAARPTLGEAVTDAAVDRVQDVTGETVDKAKLVAQEAVTVVSDVATETAGKARNSVKEAASVVKHATGGSRTPPD